MTLADPTSRCSTGSSSTTRRSGGASRSRIRCRSSRPASALPGPPACWRAARPQTAPGRTPRSAAGRGSGSVPTTAARSRPARPAASPARTSPGTPKRPAGHLGQLAEPAPAQPGKQGFHRLGHLRGRRPVPGLDLGDHRPLEPQPPGQLILALEPSRQPGPAQLLTQPGHQVTAGITITRHGVHRSRRGTATGLVWPDVAAGARHVALRCARLPPWGKTNPNPNAG